MAQIGGETMLETFLSDAVVVGCGRSATAQAAIATATVEAARRGLSLVLLVADESDTRLSGSRRSGDAMNAPAHRAAMVAEATDPLVTVDVVAVAHDDHVEAGILAARTALFVVPARGLGGHRPLFLGQMSDEVIRRARCPVMIPHVKRPVPHDVSREDSWEPSVRVVLTGRADDVDLVRFAAGEADLRGVALWVIRSIPEDASGTVVLEALGSAWHTVYSVPECAALQCRVELFADHRTDALRARCQPDDLLVLGVHDLVRRPGHGALVELIRGSVLRGTLDALPCDVMVVPLGAAAWSPTSGPRSRDVSRGVGARR